MNFVWWPSEEDKLRQFHSDGLSTRQIAAHFGITRNAVLGKINRLGLSKPALKKTANGFPKLKIKPPPRHPWRPHTPAPLPRQTPTEPACEILPVTAASLFDLTADTCRWPMWGEGDSEPRLYCGGMAIAGAPYCGKHCRVAYRPVAYQP